MPRVKIHIANPDADGIGEIVATGPNIMLGYLDQPEETKAVIKDGWFYTGDLGTIDKDGFLWIRGRSKNVIVMKNGKNIFPEEIEAMIDVLPYVEESLVFTREKHNEHVLCCLLYTSVNEVIACIMTNWIAANLVTWVFDVNDALKNSAEGGKVGYILSLIHI